METNKPNKKEHIVDTAERVFAELGYEGASTRLLAKEAGVNIGMLNYYFGSKTGLLEAVLERRIAGVHQALHDVVNSGELSAWEKLFQITDLYLDRILTNKQFHRLVHRELSLIPRSNDLYQSVFDAISKNVLTFKKVIEDGIADGTFRKVDVELTIACIFGTQYYLINSRQLASKLLETDVSQPEVLENEVKPRAKDFFHDLLKVQLSKHDTAS